MPVTVAHLSTAYLNRIRLLVERGEYVDIQSFILTAVENQLALESEGHRTMPRELPAREISSAATAGIPSYRTQSPIAEGIQNMSRVSEEAAFLLVEAPRSNRFQLPFLWGQYNRLLPSVVALRVLANMALERNTPWVPLPDLHRAAADTAVAVGEILLHRDQVNQSARGEKLSTAFPLGTRDKAKAVLRYQNQFAGVISRAGLLSGLVPSLYMANIREEGRVPEIGLTEAGLHFARMEWPVLDQTNSQMVLSDAVRRFYLEHISRHIPLELAAMGCVARAINADLRSPRELDEAVAEFLAAHGQQRSLGSTQRVGLVGRMSELGLINFDRTGLSVVYHLTDQGVAFLSSIPVQGE